MDRKSDEDDPRRLPRHGTHPASVSFGSPEDYLTWTAVASLESGVRSSPLRGALWRLRIDDSRGMQRLFSMFPRGAPGIALLVLRVAVAAALWPVGPPASSSPVGMTLAFILVGLPLCLGLVTPAAAAVCAALHVFTLACGDVGQARSAIIAIANASALALLGPGAYSIDCRLFGRRVFVVSGGSESP